MSDFQTEIELRMKSLEKRVDDFFWLFKDKVRDNCCPSCYGNGIIRVFESMPSSLTKEIVNCKDCPNTDEKIMCDYHLKKHQESKKVSFQDCHKCDGIGIIKVIYGTK